MARNYKKYTKQEVVRVGFKPTYSPSSEQEVIFDNILTTNDNLHIQASAGSGKSTTLVWIMSMLEKYNKPAAMLAFGKNIVKDIEPRCAKNVTVKTAHSFGWNALAARVGKLYLVPDKVKSILKQYPSLNPDKAGAKDKGKVWQRLNDAINLVSKLKLNLTDETDEFQVLSICNKYGIDYDEEVVSILPEVFEEILRNKNGIDYDDMMWMCIRMGLTIPSFPMVYVDECQDLSPLIIEYVRQMVTDRVACVGDVNQAIMGFAGADVHSFEKLRNTFDSTELPLNTCYRCGSDIIKLAQTMVPEIKAWSGSPTGKIDRLMELDTDMTEGSMILSRRNANLIKPCFALLKKGTKAVIRGKNIGYELKDMVDGFKATSCDDLIDKSEELIEAKIEKLLNRKKINTGAIELLADQKEIIKIFAEQCDSVPDVLRKIDSIFSDDVEGVVLSSIHKSKGLEAKHVAIVDYGRVRLCHDKMTDEDHVQEKNLNYVAVTRPKLQLDLVN